MKRRKPNIYFDRKSLGFKLGKKPLTRAEKAKRAAIAKQEKRFEQLAQRAAAKEAKKQQGALFRQLRGEAKKESAAKAKRGAATSTKDKELWEELLRSNPALKKNPGLFSTLAQSALENVMAKKTKKRKKKNGKMPAGLAAYWRKKRAKKAKKRNPKKKRRAPKRHYNPKPKPAKRRKRSTKRTAPKKGRRVTLKAPRGMSAKKFAALVRKIAPGTPVRVGKK